MEKQELKKLLLHKRMEAKAEIEQFRFLKQYTNENFENRINEKLDLINEIDRVLNELEK
jgi:hypothetical protein